MATQSNDKDDTTCKTKGPLTRHTNLMSTPTDAGPSIIDEFC